MFKLSPEEFAQALTAKDAVSSRTSCNHILVLGVYWYVGLDGESCLCVED